MTDKTLSAKASLWLATKIIFPKEIIHRWILKNSSGINNFLARPEKSLTKKGWPKILLKDLRKLKYFKVEKYIRKLSENNIKALCIEDLSYPPLLKNIEDPPPLLFFKGNLEILLKKTVSIVGSRKCSKQGIAFAKKVSNLLSKNGYTIISGLALGIDAAAHGGAIEGDGATAAVLGCGLDIVYPAMNKEIFKHLENRGCLLSEHFLGDKPLKHHFPRRNRIISGLSEKLMVIEAGERSGALITANLALEQGREVLAVPGNPNEIYSKGSNRLIKDGAFLIDDIKDIEELFEIVNNEKIPKYSDPLLEILKEKPLSIEELEHASKDSTPSLLAKLTKLEIEKIISKNESNKYFLLF